MNQIAPLPAPSQYTPGLSPVSMGEAMKLAEMMAGAKLVPAALQKSPADCLMVVMQAVRWQMDPFAVAQECSVIQGKLMHSGKLVAAVVNARGNLDERLSFGYDGQGENRTITVSGRLQGETAPRTVKVRLGDAKTSNKVWQSQPDQQLMYHGCRVWARRHTPELMLGVYSPEEFDEPQHGNGAMRDVSPAPAPAPLAAPPAQTPEELVAFMLNAIEGHDDIAKLNDWCVRHKAAFARLSAEQQETVRGAADRRRGFLMQAPPSAAEKIDAETGEIIDGEPMNPAAWLESLEGMMAGAKDLSDLHDIRADYMDPQKGRVFPPDWDAAEKMLERHETRLRL